LNAHRFYGVASARAGYTQLPRFDKLKKTRARQFVGFGKQWRTGARFCLTSAWRTATIGTKTDRLIVRSSGGYDADSNNKSPRYIFGFSARIR
jgi:hypothetical protein